MRIVGGDWRGRRLTALGKGDAGAHLRPTPDRVREALFNMLEGGRLGDPLPSAVVLDLFAGTGAMGLEALSRGAARAVFVDDGRVAGRLLRDNIRLLGCGNRARIMARDATRLPPRDETASLVFLDPPYGKGMGERALDAAGAGGWLAPGALVVWEERTPQAPPNGFEPVEQRRWGDTAVTVLRAP